MKTETMEQETAFSEKLKIQDCSGKEGKFLPLHIIQRKMQSKNSFRRIF